MCVPEGAAAMMMRPRPPMSHWSQPYAPPHDGALSEPSAPTEAIGEFFTPTPLAEQMAELLAPAPRAMVLDPAVGSGALLAACRAVGAREEDLHAWDISPHWTRVVRERFPTAHVQTCDTLCAPPPSPPHVPYIIANPPFLGKQHPYMRAHASELRERFGTAYSGEACTLFVWAILDLLAPGGRAVVLVTDTLRTLHSAAPLRRRLLTQVELERVIAVPRDAFEGCEVASALLVIRKARPRAWVRVSNMRHAPVGAPARYEIMPRRQLTTIEEMPLLLEGAPSVLAMFDTLATCRTVMDGHTGMHTRDNLHRIATVRGGSLEERYLRRRQTPGEYPVIDPDGIGPEWTPYLRAAGGRDFWSPVEEFVDWTDEARATYRIPREPNLFGHAGIVVSGIGRRLFARMMPPGCVWDSNKAIGLVPHTADDIELYLGLLCSDLYSYLAKCVLNDSSSLQLGDLRRLPFDVPESFADAISDATQRCVRAAHLGTSMEQARYLLNSLVYDSFAITPEDRNRIRARLAQRHMRVYG